MFKRVIVLLAASMILPAQSAPPAFDDVAPIVWKDVKVAFAGMRVNAHRPDAALTDAVGEFMGIPGEEKPVSFGPYAMIDGCRRHSCIEKAAVIVDARSRTIAALALRNYACRHVVLDDSQIAAMAGRARMRPAVRCNQEPVLDVYVVRRSLDPDALRAEREQLAQLRAWGGRVGHQGERVQVVVRYKPQ